MVLMPNDDEASESLGSISLTCGTDNLGNSFLLDKLLTTKYPLGVVLMELAVQLGMRNAVLRANRLPRLQNEEEACVQLGSAWPFSSGLVVPVWEASCPPLRRGAPELGRG